MKLEQNRMPLYEALNRFKRERIVPLMYQDINMEKLIKS